MVRVIARVRPSNSLSLASRDRAHSQEHYGVTVRSQLHLLSLYVSFSYLLPIIASRRAGRPEQRPLSCHLRNYFAKCEA